MPSASIKKDGSAQIRAAGKAHRSLCFSGTSKLKKVQVSDSLMHAQMLAKRFGRDGSRFPRSTGLKCMTAQ